MTKLNKAINEMTVEEAVQETIEFARKYLNIEVQPHQEYWMESIIRNEREELAERTRRAVPSSAVHGAIDKTIEATKPRGKKGGFAKK